MNDKITIRRYQEHELDQSIKDAEKRGYKLVKRGTIPSGIVTKTYFAVLQREERRGY